MHAPPVAMDPATAPLDRVALAREITALANGRAVPHAMNDVAHAAHHARRIAITGSPGAGKSTLAGHLARVRAGRQRYGILAIDPSSPKSGGAILGDRIRIDELDGTADLYVRSLGSRSANDGLSDNLPAILDTMDRHGFDEVLLETVGVGQSDYAVRALVDTVVLVLHPESGDIIQAMKAGIMEMADLYVINKSDLPNAPKSAADIQRVLSLTTRAPDAWMPRVLGTSQSKPETIVRLSEAIDAHAAWRAASSQPSRARETARYALVREIDRRVARAVAALPDDALDAPIAEQVERIVAALRTKA
jgi:LAO/AO transport system kinase